MLQFLKSKKTHPAKSDYTSVEELIENSEIFPPVSPRILKALEDISEGRQPNLTALSPEISTPLKNLATALSKRDQVDLATTVDFSVQASDSMAAVSRITGNVREIDTNAQSMAAAIEQLDASITQISATANDSSSKMQQASDLMIDGTQKVRDTALAATQTSEAMDATEEEANRVAEAVEKINDFISTIEGIAQQTNLLALNATIEAARAGDAGKGFAVVASEVKTLSGQTQAATEDISKLTESLEGFVKTLLASVAGARSSVTTAQGLTEQTQHDITMVNDIVATTATGMEEIANVLSEQSVTTKELAEGVDKIAQGSHQAAVQADGVISAVQKSESLIDRKFATLDDRIIDDYVLHRAKSDHYLWKKRLSEMLVGLNNLTEQELADHHSCRLGKWYDSLKDETLKQHPAFKALEGPHSDVHSYGRQAAALFAQGDLEGAQESILEMERASNDVVDLLDQLINR